MRDKGMMTQSHHHAVLLRRGTFSFEYATLVVVVVAALIGMAVYVKRALQGKWRAVGDTFGYGKQYEVP